MKPRSLEGGPPGPGRLLAFPAAFLGLLLAARALADVPAGGGPAPAPAPAPAAPAPGAPAPAPPAAASPLPPVYVIVVRDRTGAVDGTVLRSVTRKLERARNAGARVVVLRIETLGDYRHESALLADAVYDMRSAFDRIVAWVPNQALGGGVLPALAADEIQLAPGARIGDILHAADGSRTEPPPAITERLAKFEKHHGGEFKASLAEALAYTKEDVLRLKIGSKRSWNDLRDFEKEASESSDPLDSVRAYFRDGADKVLTPSEWKDLPPDRRAQVHRVEATFLRAKGGVRFRTKTELEKMPLVERDQVIAESVFTEHDRVMVLEGAFAVEAGLASRTSGTLEGVLASIGQAGAPVVTLDISWSERAVDTLKSPFIAAILLVVGLTSLYVELKLPGFGLPGILGLASLALYFGAQYLAGLADWWEIGVFVIGVGLLALEIFVTPGFGVLGVSGLILMGTGLLLTMTTFEQGSLPSTAADFVLIRNRIILLSGVAFSVLTCAAFLARWLPKVPILRGVILQDALGEAPAPGTEAAGAVVPAVAPGTAGFAATDLRPSGKVDFGGVRHDAIAEHEFVRKGDRVVAMGMTGGQVSVRRA